MSCPFVHISLVNEFPNRRQQSAKDARQEKNPQKL